MLQVAEKLSTLNSNMIVCYGIDGRGNKDQIGVTVNKDGLIGAGRKFYHTDDLILLADTHLSKEFGKERIFKIYEKNFISLFAMMDLELERKI